MKKNYNKITILLVAILIISVAFTVLSYFLMTKADQSKFPFEVGKMLLNFTLAVIIGGTVKLIYSKYQEQQEEYALDTYFQRKFKECNENLRTGRHDMQKHAVTKLLRLANDYKVRKQEVISFICKFVEDHYSKKANPISSDKELLIFIIKSLTQIPRIDENSHPVSINLPQVKFQDVKENEFYGLNFDYFILWGCDFIDVDLSRCSFKHADLGGTLFQGCGMEFCDFTGAQIVYSFLDNRPTIFRKCLLWKNNLHESDLSACLMENIKREEIENLNEYIKNKKVTVIDNVV